MEEIIREYGEEKAVRLMKIIIENGKDIGIAENVGDVEINKKSKKKTRGEGTKEKRVWEEMGGREAKKKKEEKEDR